MMSHRRPLRPFPIILPQVGLSINLLFGKAPMSSITTPSSAPVTGNLYFHVHQDTFAPGADCRSQGPDLQHRKWTKRRGLDRRNFWPARRRCRCDPEARYGNITYNLGRGELAEA